MVIAFPEPLSVPWVLNLDDWHVIFASLGSDWGLDYIIFVSYRIVLYGVL